MSYQINEDDINKLVIDGECIHYSIPVPPLPRAHTTYALVRHFWKVCEFANFVTHVLPDHVHRPLDITVIPKKFDPNEIYAMRNCEFGMSVRPIIYNKFIV